MRAIVGIVAIVEKNHFMGGEEKVAGGKPWTDEENKLLLSMVAEDFSFQEILDSGSFPGRTALAIRVQIQRLGVSSSEKTEHISMVPAIEPCNENMSLEKVVKLFSSAFEQMCASKEIDKFMLERFRIVFQAAKDYVPLLAGFEKWDKIEKQIEELEAAVAELRPTKSVTKA